MFPIIAEKQLDHQQREYQEGFRRGRSCAEQILNLICIMERKRTKKQKYVITFVDLKKAYDLIDRETLAKILREFKLYNKTTEIIKATLKNTTSKVKFMDELSEPFSIKIGVRQSDGLKIG